MYRGGLVIRLITFKVMNLDERADGASWHLSYHARLFGGVSQKSIFKRPYQILEINVHKMAPRATQWLQERPWNAPTKGLAWISERMPLMQDAPADGGSSFGPAAILCTGGLSCDPKGSRAFPQNKFQCPPKVGV